MSHRVLPPTRLLAVIVPVCVAGLGVTLGAIASFAVTPHKTTTVIGIAALLAASTLADRFPVPVEGIDAAASRSPSSSGSPRSSSSAGPPA